jgi:hypothetical protein
MVYRDYWALSQWYAHYCKHLQAKHLYIVAHGEDPMIATLCPGATIQTIPRDDLSHFDRNRGDLLNMIQDELTLSYDWVIRTDADELVCFDPLLFGSFADAFNKLNDQQAIFALGLNLVEASDDSELEDGQFVFLHRSNAVFSGHYSKAFAVKHGFHLARHGVVSNNDAIFNMPRGVYLVHLKYANIDALQTSNLDRIKVATGDQLGLPGKAWKDPETNALRMLRSIETLPVLDWEASAMEAYTSLSLLPETATDKGIVRAKSVKFTTRTILPGWFKSY